MHRCWALLGIGLVVVVFGEWISRWHHREYLRRTHRDATYQKAYFRRWDWRSERFVGVVIGLSMVLVGLACLGGTR